MKNIKDAVIVAYGRSAVCRANKGAFAKVNPLEYTSQVLAGVLAKIPQVDPAHIDDMIVGSAGPVNELGWNMAHLVANRTQLPVCVPGQTINRYCSSSLQAVATGANAIMCGQAETVVAGGVEWMSSPVPGSLMDCANPWLVENYPQAYMPMGITAENVAEKYGVTRQEMDQMAVESHQKAYAAQQSGGLNQAIIPVTVPGPDGAPVIVTRDEGIRANSTLEKCAALEPAFKPDGLVTAATSSQTSDGASFVVIMDSDKADSLNITPLAKFISFAVRGCPAELMGIGPIEAVPRALKLAGLTLDDMDTIELNEAFAAQAIPCIRELGMPPEKVNPWGGAMALGHPMGATGGILISKALDYLRIHGGRYALITMCIGGGMGAAGILEFLN